MYDIFTRIREDIQTDRRIPTKTLITLNPSSQVCYDENNNQIGSCLRQVWLEKNDAVKTNTIGIDAVMASYSGNWWEDWFIERLRSLNLLHNSGFPLTDVNRLVKGIVDVSIFNRSQATPTIELGEVKTYNGSNYTVASSLLGTSTVPPKPKDKHLLQAFRYSLIARDISKNDDLKVNNLFYIDRSCSGYYRNKQFKIEVIEINDNLYPKISTVWKDEYYSYVDTRISSDGIYRAEELLLSKLSTGIPDKEFVESWSEETIKSKIDNKEIPDYLVKKYYKDPMNTPLGDFQCKYCPFSNGTCKNYD